MTDLLQNIEGGWLVLLIPLIAGVVGWGTNVLALRMSFYPVEFRGIPPYLGWRGVIPANAIKLSGALVSLLSEKLLDIRELLELSPEEMNDQLDPMVERIARGVVKELSENLAPETWQRAHPALREYIVEMVEQHTRRVVEEIINDVREHADEVFDLEGVVTDAIVKDAGLLGHVFTSVAGPELRFIEVSGFWFGLLFGLFQMALWVLYPAWWVLPIGGFLVGYVTNFLALRLVFEPYDPIDLGVYRVQGLLYKRREEVARAFANVMADDVLSPSNMLATVTTGSSAERMNELVEKRVRTVFEEYRSDAMVGMLMPPERLDGVLDDLLGRIATARPDAEGLLQPLLSKVGQLRDQLDSKLSALDPRSFEAVLRPAFKEDEWKLFVTGAALGAVAGILQIVFLFGG